MASLYPAALDNLSTAHQDGVGEVIHAATDNDEADAINKIELELGVNPAGVYTDVLTRLNTLETLVFNIQSGTTYTLALSDASCVVSLINSGAVTLTIPTNASVAFTIGTQILVRSGPAAGTVTVAPAVGVVLESRGSLFSLAGPIAWATLVKTGTNTWDLFGDLA